MNRRRISVLWKFTEKSRWLFLGAIISVIIAAFFNFVVPLVFSNTIDSILDTKPFDVPVFIQNIIDGMGGREYLVKNLWVPGLLVIIFTSARAFFMFTKGRWIAVASENIAQKMRNKLYDHLQRLPYNYHVKAETGDLIQRCTTDVETVRRFLSVQLVEFVRVIAMIVIALSILLPLNPKLTLLSLMVTPFIVVFSFIFFRKIQKQFTKVEQADGKLSTVLQESMTGVRVVRAFGRQAFEKDKFETANKDYRDKNRVLMKYFAGFWGGSDLFVMLQMTIALTAGIISAVRGDITLGQFIIFISYVQMMLWPIRQFGRVLADMGKTLIAIGRIDEILIEKEETSGDNAQTPPLNRDIHFDDVTFWYDEDRPVLKNMSFDVKAGETVALLGATGSGKSSLVLLLQRLYDYQQGSVRIGDAELKHIEKHHLRSRVGIVLQEPFLYSKTIKENIGITMNEQDDDRVFDSARTAHIHDVINDFENGYDTVVGERGVTLSGGQKQRVAIARTILRDCDILIFDDSLSAVDTETDAKIRRTLKERREGVTTFIISHRISTLKEADRILVMEDGHLAQQGSHEELLQQEGLYKRIWNIQTAIQSEATEGDD